MKLIRFFIILGLFNLVFGDYPPEIPDLPNGVLWMPATWTYLELGGQISQEFNDLRNLLKQHGITAISVTDNNDLLEFLSIVPKGYIL